MSKTLLTPREMAAYLRISRATLAKWMREGIVPYARVGPRCVRFDLERVMRAVEGLGMDAGKQNAAGETRRE